MNEIWKRCPYDARYEVSDHGRVRNSRNRRVRKPSSTPSGYQVIVLSNPGSRHSGFYVHRAVAGAFIGECPEGFEVSHLDGDNQNNRLENLCYESRKDNIARKKLHGTEHIGVKAWNAKLNRGLVEKMKKIRRETGETYIRIGAMFGVSEMTAYRAIHDQSGYMIDGYGG